MKKLYDMIMTKDVNVNWSHLIQLDYAKARVVVCLWLACHERLTSKARLKRLGMLQEVQCSVVRQLRL